MYCWCPPRVNPVIVTTNTQLLVPICRIKHDMACTLRVHSDIHQTQLCWHFDQPTDMDFDILSFMDLLLVVGIVLCSVLLHIWFNLICHTLNLSLQHDYM